MFEYHNDSLPWSFDKLFKLVSSKHKYNTKIGFKTSYYIAIAPVKTNYGKINIRGQ